MNKKPAVNVPGELPGERIAPVAKFAEATVPRPPRTAFAPTVMAPSEAPWLMESSPEETPTLTVVSLKETRSVPAPSFCREAPAPMVGADAKVTVLLPRSSLAVAPAGMARREEMSSVLFEPDQARRAPLPTSITDAAWVVLSPSAPDTKPSVLPATSTRTSPLKRLAGPARIQRPAPSSLRVSIAGLPTASSASKRFTTFGFVEARVSSGAAPLSLMRESELKTRAPVPVAAIVPEPSILKLRAVLTFVAPLNSSVAPALRTSFSGSARSVMPNGLAVVPLPKSATAIVPAEMLVGAVKVLSPVSSRRPASAFTSGVEPVRTTSSVPVVGAEEAGSEPPVRVAPAARVSVLAIVRSFRSSVPAAATVTPPVPSEEAWPILIVPELMVVSAKLLATLSSRTPVPDIVRDPVPRLRPRASMVTSPAPVMVRFRFVPVTPPVRTSLSAALAINVSAPRTIAPPSVLTPERLRSAPLPETPVPAIVMASLATVMPPCTRSAAPARTVVPAAAVPSAVA